MEKSYRLVSVFFVAILLVLVWGFYRTYIQFFPGFKGFQGVQHFHGAMMLAWMLMLIVQPLLIVSGRTAMHRMVGKLSYLVAPLVLISIYLVLRLSYFKALTSMPKEVALGGIALQFPILLAFGIIYGLAIKNKANTRYHMRYMIGTSLLMIGPGLGRALIIYFGMPFPAAVNMSDYIVLGLAAIMLLNDLIRKGPWIPYTVVFVLLFMCHFIFASQMTPWWQTFASWFSKTFF